MTRESKVGLLVGTGIILLVGIVVSDHLSTKQPGPGGEHAPLAGGPGGDHLSLPADVIQPPPGDALPPGDADGARDANPLPPRDRIDPRPQGPIELRGRHDGAQGDTQGVTQDAPTDDADRGRQSTPPAGQDRPRDDRDIQPQRPTIITVQTGDTLTAIARRHLGAGTEANIKRIVDANRDRLANRDLIREGMTLVIPSPAAPRERESPSLAEQARRFFDQTTRRDTDPPRHNTDDGNNPAAAPRTYTVRSGDTLTAIARTQLGDGGRWEEIWRLNQSKVPKPDRLVEGIVLVLP